VEPDRKNNQLASPRRIRDWNTEFESRKIPRENILLESESLPAKARNFSPSAGILRSYYNRKSSAEETTLQLYHGNISVGKAEEIAAFLWGAKVGLATLARSAKGISRRMNAWLQRKLSAPQIYVFLQSIEIVQKTRNTCKHSTIASAVGVDRNGSRQLLALACTAEPSGDLWECLLSDLKKRGLRGTELFVGETDPALRRAANAHFPEVFVQSCLLDFKQEVQRRAEAPQIGFVWQAFRKIKSSSGQREAIQTTEELRGVLRREHREDAAEIFQNWNASQFSYLHFPKSHWNRLRDVGSFKQVLREFRETIRIIGPITDDHALTLMAAAKFRSVEKEKWASLPFVTFGRPSAKSDRPQRSRIQPSS